MSIAGWNATGSQGRYFRGDIQEVAILQQVLTPTQVRAFMFADLPVTNLAATLKGYFKLGSSVETNSWYRNSALTPPPGTTNATPFGTVVFEPLDVAGEQSIFDARRNGGLDSIVPLSGSFSWEQVALARPTPGIAFDLRFTYCSANASPSAKLGEFDPFEVPDLGRGWRHTFEARILPEGGLSEVRMLTWSGAIETWLQSTNDSVGMLYKTRHKEYRGELHRLTSGDFEWTTAERLVYRFRNPFPSEFDPPADDLFLLKKGFLEEIRDLNGNVVRVSRSPLGRIDSVADSAGLACTFSYTNNLISSLVLGSWQVQFAYDTNNNRLISKSITNTSGLYANATNTWQFTYSAANGLLERIIDPRGNTNSTVQYDKYGRMTNQIDALGYATATTYGGGTNRTIKHIDPDQKEWIETYDRKGRAVAQQDPLTNITRYAYDERGNRTNITDALQRTTSFSYDERANVTNRVNALGERTSWVFHSFFNKAIQEITPQPTNINGSATWTNFYDLDNATGNLTNHWDALGSLVRYTYQTNGLVLSSTDANLTNTTHFLYDTNGFLISRTDPAGFTHSFAYNDVGWKLAETNALGLVTTYAYDLNGNVVLTVDPLQRAFTKTYDENGNLTAASDAKGQLTRYAYDAANQKTNMVDRATNAWSFTYTKRGKLETTTSPIAGIATTNFYDAANRLEHVSDPAGNTITNIYDPNGNLAVLVDQLTNRWTKTYDRLNRVVAETDPQGDTKQTSYDVAGRIDQIITPKGYPSSHFYDGRGRLSRWIDAENYSWFYTYDGNGNILDITDSMPIPGHYRMTYGLRNERLTELNQDLKEWRYTYDALLRLKTQTDPNGTVRTVNYDDGGRIDSVGFSTGRINSFQYDENNNPLILSRSGSGPATLSSLAYDGMDRVTEYRDTFSKRIRYAHDELGRIKVLTYPDGKVLTQGYDLLSRLTNQVFAFSNDKAFTNTYAYDPASRLVRRTYPNGVVQTNDFDNSGQLTNLTYQASGIRTPASVDIALTYAYDRNGNKVASTETGTLDWSNLLPNPSDERSDFTAAGRLTNRVDVLFPTNHFTYEYDASGNMTNAAGWQSYALTYDEDNRTTTICWKPGALCEKRIVNRYDALGRRVAKTDDGKETRYVLDLASKMERILCDTASNGAITAWYVHGPDLTFKVDPAAGLTCYHADAQGNIIALTDVSATNTAQYAYTPYGRTLPSSSSSLLTSNSFTFVGSQGVMEELPGLYFMRARYYSADAGLFLSTDPVKHIGPTWRPSQYNYGNGNPLAGMDPQGTSFRSFFSGVSKSFTSTVRSIGSTLSKARSLAANPAAKAAIKVVTSVKSTAKSITSTANAVLQSAATAARRTPFGAPLDIMESSKTLDLSVAWPEVSLGPLSVQGGEHHYNSRRGIWSDSPSLNTGDGTHFGIYSVSLISASVSRRVGNLTAGLNVGLGIGGWYKEEKDFEHGVWNREFNIGLGEDFGLSLSFDRSSDIAQRQAYEAEQLRKMESLIPRHMTSYPPPYEAP